MSRVPPPRARKSPISQYAQQRTAVSTRLDISVPIRGRIAEMRKCTHLFFIFFKSQPCTRATQMAHRNQHGIAHRTQLWAAPTRHIQPRFDILRTSCCAFWISVTASPRFLGMPGSRDDAELRSVVESGKRFFVHVTSAVAGSGSLCWRRTREALERARSFRPRGRGLRSFRTRLGSDQLAEAWKGTAPQRRTT